MGLVVADGEICQLETAPSSLALREGEVPSDADDLSDTRVSEQVRVSRRWLTDRAVIECFGKMPGRIWHGALAPQPAHRWPPETPGPFAEQLGAARSLKHSPQRAERRVLRVDRSG